MIQDRMPSIVVESNPAGRVRDSLFSVRDKQETRKLLGQGMREAFECTSDRC
jgi:hypothetical protein